MRIVIFTGGVLRDGIIVRNIIKEADLIVAADSGAKTSLQLGTVPNVVIGDFDGLDRATKNKLAKKECELIEYPSEKDETDTELALHYALDKGATRISILGGIEGDRIDHILANIFLLTSTDVPIHFVNGSTDVWVVKGPTAVNVAGQSGDLLSLLPLSVKVTAITTNGLKYPLQGEPLLMNKTRGVSNVFTGKKATVEFKSGTLLLVHTSN